MKKISIKFKILFLFLFCFFIFGNVSGQGLVKRNTKKIIGTWKIENISITLADSQTQTEQSKNLIKELFKDANWDFSQNYECKFNISEIKNAGKWSISESGKQIIIELDASKTVYEIVSLKKSVCRLENKTGNELRIIHLYR